MYSAYTSYTLCYILWIIIVGYLKIVLWKLTIDVITTDNIFVVFITLHTGFLQYLKIIKCRYININY